MRMSMLMIASALLMGVAGCGQPGDLGEGQDAVTPPAARQPATSPPSTSPPSESNAASCTCQQDGACFATGALACPDGCADFDHFVHRCQADGTWLCVFTRFPIC